jgi:hypothetical protein
LKILRELDALAMCGGEGGDGRRGRIAIGVRPVVPSRAVALRPKVLVQRLENRETLERRAELATEAGEGSAAR